MLLRKLLHISNFMLYFAIFAIIRIFSDWLIWDYLWLLWFLGLPALIAGFPLYVQSFVQVGGMIITPIIHRPLPNKDNFVPQVKYSLPFKGRWVAVNGGVTKATSHSWSLHSQRYAYDFIMLDQKPEPKSFAGDFTVATNYYCYGQEIVAPADGVVVAVRDKYPDGQIAGGGKTDPLTLDLRGNYIVIRHAPKEYSVLAHLKPGSILVKVGQNVARKETMAECGNSGNSTEPHLHFQLQNSQNFFTAAGLPLHFTDFEAVPATNYAKFDPRPLATEAEPGPNFISRGQLVGNR